MTNKQVLIRLATLGLIVIMAAAIVAFIDNERGYQKKRDTQNEINRLQAKTLSDYRNFVSELNDKVKGWERGGTNDNRN